MAVLPFDVARHQWGGVNDGYTGTFPQGAGLEKEQQMGTYPHLPLDKTVVGERAGEFLMHMFAHVAQIEGLELAETVGVEYDQYQHNLAV